MVPEYACPQCQAIHPAPFRTACPACGFSVAHLTGQTLSSFQKQNWEKHTELLRGQNIYLHGGDFNASFDHVGSGNLADLVRFTVSYGHTGEVESTHGGHKNQVRIAYTHEVIGSGVTAYTTTPFACSGICVISPKSLQYGHVYPIIDLWVQEVFSGKTGVCAICRKLMPFGHPVCQDCYQAQGGDWRKLL